MATTSTESIKLHLISQIAALEDSSVLTQLEKILNVPQTSDKDDLLKRLSKTRRKTLDIDALKKEQIFTQFNRSRFDELIKELAIKEPIEQLIQMI